MTVCKSIASLSAIIKEQFISYIKQGEEFSLQIEKHTDTSDDAQLLVHAHYLGKNNLKEECLFCRA